MAYRKCFVPTCLNDSTNNPDKIFVRIREDLREKWCRQINVEYLKICTMFCCEDHFDPKEDLKNYYKHKLMNEEPVLKPNAVLNICKSTQHSNADSELKKMLLSPNIVSTRKRRHDDIDMPSTSLAYISHNMKVNVGIQCKVKMVDKSTNFKGRKVVSTSSAITVDEIPSSQEVSSGTTCSLYGCTSETEEAASGTSSNKLQIRKIMLDLITNKPKMYLGLPKQYLWLLEYIIENSPIKINYIYLIATLLKIKQNDSIERISDQLNVSRTVLSNMILKGIEILANFFQNLIICPEPYQIKRNLPLVFKIRYSNIQMIIDCFEIQIVKPSDPLKQAQTWSQYKNCNTIKYLIGCTPNGLVSFISEGYGGRISDKAIVEKSNLLDVLRPNAVVLADRGFKEIESLLSSRGIKLLRPPSVYSGIKQSYSDTVQSKVIASLRVHVERVIRRVREFTILKPHSTVTYQYVPYLDEIVKIVCGLINLQGEIIKTF